MKVPPTFEIRVALIGYVSVGKTTVLNALFAAKYGQVAMKRTTAVVNNFRVSSPDQGGVTAAAGNRKDDKEREAVKWATTVDTPRSASSTLEETIRDNEAHRNSETIVEKTYDIVLNEPLHDMRRDTKLVIVDIPGINEAGTSSKYKDYVNEHWHTFDVAVVVVDGRQGVNTEEQLDLIKLIQENTKTRKDIPSILLLNKIDDPYDSDQKILIEEFRRYTERVFSVSDRKRSLKKMIDEREEREEEKAKAMEEFVKLSKDGGRTIDSLDFPALMEALGTTNCEDGNHAKAIARLSKEGKIEIDPFLHWYIFDFMFASDEDSETEIAPKACSAAASSQSARFGALAPPTGGLSGSSAASAQQVAHKPKQRERPFGAPAQAPSSFAAPAPAPSGGLFGSCGAPAPSGALFGAPAPSSGTFGSGPAPAPVGARATLTAVGAVAPIPSVDSPFRGTGATTLSDKKFPVVISVSAMHAFLYRCGSQLSFERFCKMDQEFIDKLGKESYGRQWYRFGRDEQLQKAFEAVKDEEQRKNGVAISNFGTFLKVLDICIGDKEKQKRILLRQVETHCVRLLEANEEADLGAAFGNLYETSVLLGGNHSHQCEVFWQAFSKKSLTCFRQFIYEKKPEYLALLSASLFSYFSQVRRFGLEQETPKIIAKAKELVINYVKVVCAGLEIMTYSFGSTTEGLFTHLINPGFFDKLIILYAILTVASLEPTFSLEFGELRVMLELCRIQEENNSNSSSHIHQLLESIQKPVPPIDSPRTCCDQHSTYAMFCTLCENARKHPLQRIDRLMWTTQMCTDCGLKGKGGLLTPFQERGLDFLRCESCGKRYFIGENGPWFEQTPGYDVKVESQFFQSSIEDPRHFGHFVWACCVLIRQATEDDSPHSVS
uniref:Dynamin N-terminal domain-containing protein n=1 Tax=Amphora coffeiformis TaxID=265554 RepID=A0A7S3L1Q9_9STRA